MGAKQNIIYAVYVLKSLSDGKRYVGMTSNLQQRITAHNAGKVFSTKSRRPFDLIYHESFVSRLEARQREEYLKSGAGRRFLNKIMPTGNMRI